MATPVVLTYFDLIDRCQDFLSGNSGTAAVRDIRAAIQDALRELVHVRRWNYFIGRHRVRFDDDYSTGTISYDHTGSTYERELTLSSGTWPTNAIYGEVTIDGKSYTVEDKKSTTVLTLDSNNNPGADITSGTSYSWARSVYPFPSNFVRIINCVLENGQPIQYLTPGEMLTQRSTNNTPSTPYLFTIRGDENLFGSTAVEFCPPPNDDLSLEIVYERRPRQLRIDGKDTTLHSKGTISTTVNSATVTGSGTAFTSAMVGSMIRIGDDATNIPTELGGTEPYVEQRVIIAVGSATSLTLDAVAANTQSGVKYVVSDPVDINATLLTALLRGIEYQLGVRRRAKDLNQLQANYKQALYAASEADNVNGIPRYVGDADELIWYPGSD